MSEDLRERITHRRYSGRPFPAYRFTPGRDPHPTANPAGHSYEPPGTPPRHHEVVSPEKWRDCESYLFACDLYNHAYWWEAHEEWEGIWKAFDKGTVPRRFLQGLIQVSACHLKLFLKHLDGVERLRASSRSHLQVALAGTSESRFMGLDLPRFVTAVDRYYQAVLAAPEGSLHQPSGFPFIELA
jgi:uncharacterized protein